MVQPYIHAFAGVPFDQPLEEARKLIDPKQIRRINRAVQMGLSAALHCLQQAGGKTPDAIITATGLGCIESTWQFLERMYNGQHLPVNPSAFIQSTHNTLGAQIALQLHCQGYNNTITDEALAFELALDDACAYLYEYPEHTVLLGAVDELTPQSIDIFRQLHRTATPLQTGEGAVFFLLSTQPPPASAPQIKQFHIGQQPSAGGDSGYKALCGRYPTAGAFGLLHAIKTLPSQPGNEITITNNSRYGYGSTLTLTL